ncbi:MAG TPA: hypothetical protein VF453_08395 [Burkholderiaceae bacterium]
MAAVESAFLRLVRLAVGGGLLWGAYEAAAWGWPALDKPFAALTIRDLLTLVLGLALAAMLAPSALAVAFGAGSKTPQPSIEDAARGNVMHRLKMQEREAATQQAERARLASWYSRSKWLGVLFDPSIARKHRWLPFVAVLGAYALLALVDYVVSHLSP